MERERRTGPFEERGSDPGLRGAPMSKRAALHHEAPYLENQPTTTKRQ